MKASCPRIKKGVMAHGPRFLRIAEDGSTGNDYLFYYIYLFIYVANFHSSGNYGINLSL